MVAPWEFRQLRGDHLIRLDLLRERAGVLSPPDFRRNLRDEFFEQHCPKHCS